MAAGCERSLIWWLSVSCLISKVKSTDKRVGGFPFMESLGMQRGWDEFNRRSASEPTRRSD